MNTDRFTKTDIKLPGSILKACTSKRGIEYIKGICMGHIGCTKGMDVGGAGVHLVVADLVHELEALEGLPHSDTDVLLSQGNRPEAVVKIEQALVPFHTQEGCHVLIVGQRG